MRLQLVWPLRSPGSFSIAGSVNRTIGSVGCRALGNQGSSWEASSPS